jgi:hypothetical protein
MAPGASFALARSSSKVAAAARLSTDVGSTLRVTWEQLAPETRVVSMRVSSTLHAAMKRAAATAGLTLTEWCEGVLTVGVVASMDELRALLTEVRP